MGHLRHFERVRALVSGHSGVPEAEIGMETRLVEDVDIVGDTGDEFLETFAHEFGVDMTGMAPFNYFDDEPPLFWFSEIIPIAAGLSPAFRRYVLHATRGRRAVTVRDLIASAHAGRWIRPGHRRTDLDPLRVTWKSIATMGLVTPAVAMSIILMISAVIGSHPGDPDFVIAALPAIFLAMVGGKAYMANSWLRRLDAAATDEEQHLSAGR